MYTRLLYVLAAPLHTYYRHNLMYTRLLYLLAAPLHTDYRHSVMYTMVLRGIYTKDVNLEIPDAA